MIGGAKILRDRFEELHGAFPDAEPARRSQSTHRLFTRGREPLLTLPSSPRRRGRQTSLALPEPLRFAAAILDSPPARPRRSRAL
jgi:hypothetical protein